MDSNRDSPVAFTINFGLGQFLVLPKQHFSCAASLWNWTHNNSMSFTPESVCFQDYFHYYCLILQRYYISKIIIIIILSHTPEILCFQYYYHYYCLILQHTLIYLILHMVLIGASIYLSFIYIYLSIYLSIFLSIYFSLNLTIFLW